MICLLVTRLDGGVSVVSPAPALIMEFHLYGRATGSLLWTGPAMDVTAAVGGAIVLPFAEAEVAAVAFIRAKNIPSDAANVSECEFSDLPNQRFRNCWRRVGADLPAVDMPLACVQRMGEVRKQLEGIGNVKEETEEDLVPEPGEMGEKSVNRIKAFYDQQSRELDELVKLTKALNGSLQHPAN